MKKENNLYYYLMHVDGKLLPHSFIGFCKYGSGESNEITDVRTKTTMKCQQECEKTANCTAFSFNTNVIRNCELYEGGPYTYGYNIYDSKGTKNDTSVKCYIMPSKGKHYHHAIALSNFIN